MYPRMYLENFWLNDMTNEVFVAMSFKSEFEKRWSQIIQPTVSEIDFSGDSLRAIRVDIRKRGDSILTEIMDGICHSQLIIADVSVTDRWNENNKKNSCRNGNVMYEVGLAVACRQPVEIILLRDDEEDLLFDIAHIPVTKYRPENIGESKQLLRQLILDRLHERSLEFDLRVRKVLRSLSAKEIIVIHWFSEEETVKTHMDYSPIDIKRTPEVHELIQEWKFNDLEHVLSKLLEKNILQCLDLKAQTYAWTTFGKVVVNIIRNKFKNVSKSVLKRGKRPRKEK